MKAKEIAMQESLTEQLLKSIQGGFSLYDVVIHLLAKPLGVAVAHIAVVGNAFFGFCFGDEQILVRFHESEHGLELVHGTMVMVKK
jgi:hypothetical protein